MGRIVVTWEQGETLCLNVCLLLGPADWRALRAAHHGLTARLGLQEMRQLFSWGLQVRLDAALFTSRTRVSEFCLDGKGDDVSILHVLSVATTMDAMAEVLKAVVAQPRLVEPGLVPVRQVLLRLRKLVLHDESLMPKERSGRRSTLPRRLLRSFASLSGLMPPLTGLLCVFPPGLLPCIVFVSVCEVVAGLIHNAKEFKRIFVASGGLRGVLAYLRVHPKDSEVQAAGLAVLLALSARSVLCIRIMADCRTHEVVAAALQRFPTDTKVVSRAAGVLANMSNVPCIRPALEQSGALGLARNILTEESQPGSPFVRDFVQYMVSNVQGHDEV